VVNTQSASIASHGTLELIYLPALGTSSSLPGLCEAVRMGSAPVIGRHTVYAPRSSQDHDHDWIGHIVTPLVTMHRRQASTIHVEVGDA
jgi:hypothetical protein